MTVSAISFIRITELFNQFKIYVAEIGSKVDILFYDMNSSSPAPVEDPSSLLRYDWATSSNSVAPEVRGTSFEGTLAVNSISRNPSNTLYSCGYDDGTVRLFR